MSEERKSVTGIQSPYGLIEIDWSHADCSEQQVIEYVYKVLKEKSLTAMIDESNWRDAAYEAAKTLVAHKDAERLMLRHRAEDGVTRWAFLLLVYLCAFTFAVIYIVWLDLSLTQRVIVGLGMGAATTLFNVWIIGRIARLHE